MVTGSSGGSGVGQPSRPRIDGNGLGRRRIGEGIRLRWRDGQERVGWHWDRIAHVAPLRIEPSVVLYPWSESVKPAMSRPDTVPRRGKTDLRGLVASNRVWYHTLELAPDVVTPGWFDLRPII